MEKLTIKPWQIMQAESNQAKIEWADKGLPNYDLIQYPEWNWVDFDFRIANLTADGMRLDELVEKCCANDICVLEYPLRANEDECYFSKSSNTYASLLGFCVSHPECISQIKVKQEAESCLLNYTTHQHRKS